MGKELLSQFHVEKQRVRAIVAPSHGAAIVGFFFVAGTASSEGPERVLDLLNANEGFVPFGLADNTAMTSVLLQRDHIVTVTLDDHEARRVPGYTYAISRRVSLRLTTGERLTGDVRVYRPAGRDRLSDWARHGNRFRYVETGATTVIVNVNHIVEAREVE